MSLQFHPLVFGLMLVVAVGTAAYTYWKSRNQHANYTNPGGGYTNSKRGGYANSQRGGYTNSERGSYTNSERGGYTNSERGVYTNSERGGYTNSERGGYINSERGGYTNSERGGYTYSERGGVTNSESGPTSRHWECFSDTDFDDCSSTKSSILDKDERPKKKRNSDCCAICSSSLKSPLKALTCTHIFHENCITDWLATNNTCPMCCKIGA